MSLCGKYAKHPFLSVEFEMEAIRYAVRCPLEQFFDLCTLSPEGILV